MVDLLTTNPSLSCSKSSTKTRGSEVYNSQTFWYGQDEKSYTAQDNGAVFVLVRWIDFLVQLESGGGGVSMVNPIAGNRLRCKFGASQLTETLRSWRTNGSRRPSLSVAVGDILAKARPAAIKIAAVTRHVPAAITEAFWAPHTRHM
jgi:hypothetical protein